MEFFDIADENGVPTGRTVSREEAHAKGILHRVAHIWIVRNGENGFELLLQKRASVKESYPGCLDTSSAGHISAGEEPSVSARRELAEELGIDAAEGELEYIGSFRIYVENVFHGKPFRDNEYGFVYVLKRAVDAAGLKLQAEEVDSCLWLPLDEVVRAVYAGDSAYCICRAGIDVIRSYCEKAGTLPW